MDDYYGLDEIGVIQIKVASVTLFRDLKLRDSLLVQKSRCGW